MLRVVDVCVGYCGCCVLYGINVDFCYGLHFIIGPNGSGKSTLLRVIAGVLSPWRGDVLLNGDSIFRNPRLKRRIGYMPHGVGLLPHLTVRENFILYAELMGLTDRSFIRNRIEELCEIFKLWDIIDKKVNELSHGQRVRVGIARTLIHDPDVVVLDEPTAGLDPYFVIEILNIFTKLSKSKIVIITTHSFNDIKNCPHETVVLLHRGRVVFRGKFSELIEKFKPKRRLVLKFRGESSKVYECLNEIGLKPTVLEKDYAVIETDRYDIDILTLTGKLLSSGIVVEDIKEDQDYIMHNIMKMLITE